MIIKIHFIFIFIFNKEGVEWNGNQAIYRVLPQILLFKKGLEVIIKPWTILALQYTDIEI